MTHPLVAVAALGLAAALVLGASTAPPVLLVAVVLVQAPVVLGWHRALGVPGAVGGALVAGLAALAADVLVLVTEGDRPLAYVPSVLALAVIAGLVHQLARRDGRERLNASLSATVSLAAVAALASAFLAVETSDAGAPLVAAAAVPVGVVVAAGVLRHRLGGPGWVDLVVVGAVTILALVLPAVTDLPATAALAVAAAAGLAAWVAGLVLARVAGPQPGLAAGLPYVMAGPVAYVLGRLLVG